MIRDLRQRHRHIIMVLGVFLPVVFVIGVAERKPRPVMATFVAENTNPPTHFDALVWERAGQFAKSPIIIRLLREQKNGGTFALQFITARDFLKPDLLVYWAGGAMPVGGKLPDNSLLLGAFSPGVSLPFPAAPKDGKIILYSLVEQEIIDVSQPISIQ